MKLLIALLLLSTSAWADPVALFKNSFPANTLGPLNQQAFCWENSLGSSGNYRGDVPQRLASVTKLFTTLLALETMKPEKTWTTTVWVSGTRVHIAGGLDPWFEEEKIFALVQALKDKGVSRITELTYDGSFVFTDTAQSKHTPASFALTTDALKRYFTSNGVFGAVAKARLKSVAAFQKEENLDFTLPTSGIATTKITPVDKNPLVGVSGVQTYRHTSRSLVTIVKAMNVMSKNMVANMLWEQGKRIKRPADVYATHGIAAKDFAFYSGSGLPVISGQNRADNLATCHAVMKMLNGLEKKITALNLNINELVGVGTDLGSYKDRFLNDLTLKEAVAAKTGTLKHSSALAGWIAGEPASVRFVILNHTTNTVPSRNWQDRFLSQWMKNITASRGYVRESIYPLDGAFFN